MPIFKYLPNWESVFDHEFALVRVGQHALSRIIQRSGLVKSDYAVDNNLIFSEFKYLSLWAAFWSQLLFESNCIDNLKYSELSILVPAPNGLLICQLIKEKEIQFCYSLEVRTYVNINQLSSSQSNLRLSLIEASYELESTPLSFFPFFVRLHEHEKKIADLIFMLLLFRIKDFTDSTSFEICKNNFNAHKLNQNLDHFIVTRLGKLCNFFEKLNDYINIHGYENFSQNKENSPLTPELLNNLKNESPLVY